jgi:hypothetical protein
MYHVLLRHDTVHFALECTYVFHVIQTEVGSLFLYIGFTDWGFVNGQNICSL